MDAPLTYSRHFVYGHSLQTIFMNLMNPCVKGFGATGKAYNQPNLTHVILSYKVNVGINPVCCNPDYTQPHRGRRCPQLHVFVLSLDLRVRDVADGRVCQRAIVHGNLHTYIRGLERQTLALAARLRLLRVSPTQHGFTPTTDCHMELGRANG